MTEPAPTSRPFARYARRALRWLCLALLWLVLFALTLWATLAVCFASLPGTSPRHIRAALFAVIAVAAVIFMRPRRYRWTAPIVLFLLVLAWFFSLEPSNDRDWTPDVARLAWADVNGDRVTLHNVRNFAYRSETDFTPAWEDRTYDLSRLKTVDLMLVYWGSKAIAHAMVSFVFDDGQYLAVSIETRKQHGESYSALQGFFRQYELIYIFADERDVVRLRTNYRHEDVYLYHSRVSPQHARAIFLSYLDSANALRQKPEWYNALTTNCATSLLPHARAGGGKGEMSIDVLLSGYAARQAYRNGAIDTSLPFEQLEARSRVNEKALALPDGDLAEFSNRIRAGLPLPAGWAGGTTGPTTTAAPTTPGAPPRQ
jgi:hypothetical protein